MSLSNNSTHAELYQQIDSYDALLAHSHRLDSARKLLGCVYRYKSVHKLSSHHTLSHQQQRSSTMIYNNECRSSQISCCLPEHS